MASAFNRLCLISCFVAMGLACTPSNEGADDGNAGGGDGGAQGGGGGQASGGARGGAAGSSSQAAGGAGGGGGAATTTPGAWWDPQWTQRRKVTANLTAGSLQNVPLLVAIPQDQVSGAAVDGLRFVAEDGSVLPHEVQGTVEGRILVWVRFANTQDAIWLYYGNPQAVALPKNHAESVWGSESAVWHLEGDGHEAGPGAFDASNQNAAFAEGRIGKSYQGSSGQKSNLALSREDSADKRLLSGASGITISAWVKPTDFKLLGDKPFDRQVLSVGTTKEDSNYNHAAAFLAVGLEKNGNAGGHVVAGARPTGDEETVRSTQTVAKNEWTHIAAVIDLANKRGRLFMNGKADGDWIGMGDLEASAFVENHEAKSTHIGASSGGGYGYFDGGLDEIRLERKLRDEAWISAIYENMKAPGDTVELGSSESVPGL